MPSKLAKIDQVVVLEEAEVLISTFASTFSLESFGAAVLGTIIILVGLCGTGGLLRAGLRGRRFSLGGLASFAPLASVPVPVPVGAGPLAAC
mgnify:CR=1 FL=1